MKDNDCVQFLLWVLPKLDMRWAGFRKVRKQVCKRFVRRILALGLVDTNDYKAYLEHHPAEWSVLENLCRITISRFYRDKGVFLYLENEVIPALIQQLEDKGEHEIKVWSIGCASGEEPYTLAIIWTLKFQPEFPGTKIKITATDIDTAVLDRAAHACYNFSSLKELPKLWRNNAFTKNNSIFYLNHNIRQLVQLVSHDIRTPFKTGLFHIILCRNLVFTYFDIDVQIEILSHLKKHLFPSGILVIGIHETLPNGESKLIPLNKKLGIYKKIG